MKVLMKVFYKVRDEFFPFCLGKFFKFVQAKFSIFVF